MKRLSIFVLLLSLSFWVHSQSLQTAVATDNLDELKAYIKKYGVNYPQDKFYPIVAAAQYGRYGLIKYLMENGADINAREYKKRTALMYAIKNNHIEIATYLLSFKPDLTPKDYKGNTALEIAHKVKNFDAIKKHLPENPFVSADGPYIFKARKKYNAISIVKDKDGNYYKEHQSIEKTKNPFLAVCRNSDGDTLFQFEIYPKFKPEHENIFKDVSKIVAISDIEGNFEEFKNLLLASKVINESYEWIFGDGHLVLLGDFFDRGAQVTECLWLAYHLEQQAAKAGGKSHFLIGNHEEMNLSGDTRYVHFKYISNADFIDINYKALYNNKSILGKWLRSKNGIVKINNNLFLHAGISPEFLEKRYSINTINTVIQNYVASNRTIRNDHYQAHDVFNTKTGPLWYRGLIKGTADQDEVERILKFYRADRMIIGHSTVNEITSFYEKCVIDIDVKHSLGADVSRALLIKDGHYYTVGVDYKKLLF